MVLETWGTVPHTVAEKKIEIEAKSKKLSTFLLFHNTRENLMVFSGSTLRPSPPLLPAHARPLDSSLNVSALDFQVQLRTQQNIPAKKTTQV